MTIVAGLYQGVLAASLRQALAIAATTPARPAVATAAPSIALATICSPGSVTRAARRGLAVAIPAVTFAAVAFNAWALATLAHAAWPSCSVPAQPPCSRGTLAQPPNLIAAAPAECSPVRGVHASACHRQFHSAALARGDALPYNLRHATDPIPSQLKPCALPHAARGSCTSYALQSGFA